MKKVAALDLGSNTFLCLIAEGESGAIHRVLYDDVQTVRLGQDVQKTKVFHAEALVRAKKTLTDFSKIIEKYQVDSIQAVATAAARNVSNGQELFKICDDLKIPLKIISGKEEAETTFLGALAGKQNFNKVTLVIDIGGGSTELIVGKEKTIIYSESLKLGGVQLKDYFGFSETLSVYELQKIDDYLQKEIRSSIGKIIHNNIECVFSVAGTPTEIASHLNGGFNKDKIENFNISISTINDYILKMSELSVQDRIEILKVNAGRADIIIYGALILKNILKSLNIQSTLVGTQGVRYGVAEKLLQK